MTTTSGSYYDYRYSPPVSPKSQPHGCKRKSSTQDDETENQSLISNSLKRLRLSKSVQNVEALQSLSTGSDGARRSSALDITRNDAPYHGPLPLESVLHHNAVPTNPHPPKNDLITEDDDDLMPVDDSADRVWVHDLNAEIAEIEAEEERQRNEIQILDAGKDYSKIPEHLLKQNAQAEDPTANMQMILYRDPVSISLPEEEDAVRKTIIEARKRARERQAEEYGKEVSHSVSRAHVPPPLSVDYEMMNHDDDEMDMDID